MTTSPEIVPAPVPVADIEGRVAALYDAYGQRKAMGESAPKADRPHYFLLRTFAGDNDLLLILNTKRCRYQCHFCTLPHKSSQTWIEDHQVVAQFAYAVEEVKHALSIIDRVSLSNEGSLLDESTIGRSALDQIISGIGQMRQVRRIEVETRLEFVTTERLRHLSNLAPRASLGILTGFETVDERIRDRILKKREPLPAFLAGLDRVAAAGLRLTAYVLFKPDPEMSDEAAMEESLASIRYLVAECGRRDLPLSIRLNPMYRAEGSAWERKARELPDYRPPRLTDVMRVAETAASEGVSLYVGLSTEGLSGDDGAYPSREDYSRHLIRAVKLFNDRKIQRFDWDQIGGALETARS